MFIDKTHPTFLHIRRKFFCKRARIFPLVVSWQKSSQSGSSIDVSSFPTFTALLFIYQKKQTFCMKHSELSTSRHSSKHQIFRKYLWVEWKIGNHKCYVLRAVLCCSVLCCSVLWCDVMWCDMCAVSPLGAVLCPLTFCFLQCTAKYNRSATPNNKQYLPNCSHSQYLQQ